MIEVEVVSNIPVDVQVEAPATVDVDHGIPGPPGKDGAPGRDGSDGVPKLAYTLDRRRADILAYFDHPRTSNGPTEAINGRLERLRGSALGFRNLTHYIARSLLETGAMLQNVGIETRSSRMIMR